MTDFDKRAREFWLELDGIIKLLNDASPDKKHIITSVNNPIVPLFFQWRTLNELKKVKSTEASLKREIKKFLQEGGN